MMSNTQDNMFRDILEHVRTNRHLDDDGIIKSVAETFGFTIEEATKWYDSVYTEIVSGNY